MKRYALVSTVQRRRQRRAQTARRAARWTSRSTWALAAVLALGGLAVVLAASLAFTRLTADLPALETIAARLDPQTGDWMRPTRIEDRQGRLLLELGAPAEMRGYGVIDATRADALSPELAAAVVAARQPDFWTSPGVALRQWLNPQPATIAEQVTLDLLLSNEPASTRRALRMRLLAAQAVHDYGRSKVLEWYLNTANFGRQIYGAPAAAQYYLGKSADQLSLAEAALLAATLEAPGLNPLDAPDEADLRQKELLANLRARGVIDESAYQRALASRPGLRAAPLETTDLAPAFTRLVIDQLAAVFGRERLERGGLVARTTLDLDEQRALECLTAAYHDGAETEDCPAAQLLGGGAGQAAQSIEAAALDPGSGEVLALVGNGAHQPGSLLSPLAAAAGFARGLGPASLVWDIPASLPEAAASRQNPDGRFHGPARLRLALANDYLSPLAGWVGQFGASNVWRLGAALGLNLPDGGGPELLYAGGAVTPLEAARAYGAFASGGTLAVQHLSAGDEQPTLEGPVTLLSVTDAAGRTALEPQVERRSIFSAQIAYLMNNTLSDESARWPSLGAPNLLEIGRPAGAKVGRVAGEGAPWVVGYTPQRVTAVWAGAASGETNVRLPAAFWHAWMQSSHQNLPATGWTRPEGVATLDVCDPSGLLPGPDCPLTATEIFTQENQPVTYDTLYKRVVVNRETGRLATVFTPPAMTEERTFMVVPAEARSWAEQAGLPVPPVDYDTIQAPLPDPEVNIRQPAGFSFVRGVVEIHGTASGADFAQAQVQAGAGINPETWVQIGETLESPVTAGPLATWDTSGLNGLYVLRLLLVRADRAVETAMIQVSVDNTPPEAGLIYPSEGQVFSRQEMPVITFQARAADVAGLARVSWWVDGKEAGSVTQAPFALPWRATLGAHTLAVRAEDLAGNLTESAPVTFSVK